MVILDVPASRPPSPSVRRLGRSPGKNGLEPIETVSGRIEAGTASAAHYTLAGAVRGNPFVTFEEYIRFGPGDDFLPQDWPEGHGHRVILKGIPDIRMNIIFGNENGS